MSPDDQDTFRALLGSHGVDADNATLNELEDALTDLDEEEQDASLDYDEENGEWRST